MKHVGFVMNVEGQFAKFMHIQTKSLTTCIVSFINIEGEGIEKRGMKMMDVSQQVTVKCCKCGQDVKLTGILVGDWSQVTNYVCEDCRSKMSKIELVTIIFEDGYIIEDGEKVKTDAYRSEMKKLQLTRILYEDGFEVITGDCDFCNQFPCSHVSPDGQFSEINLWKMTQKERAEWLKKV
jgi:hypothetical protein